MRLSGDLQLMFGLLETYGHVQASCINVWLSAGLAVNKFSNHAPSCFDALMCFVILSINPVYSLLIYVEGSLPKLSLDLLSIKNNEQRGVIFLKLGPV